jgi:GT2 family glycosyltransferase
MLILFSIIVPSYSRSEQLAQLLFSLTQLDYPRERFEVIVVIDGGEKPDSDLIANFSHQLNISVIQQPHRGPAAARNRGAAVARGSYLVFTDDDCLPVSNWLRILEKSTEENPGCAIGGRVLPSLPENLYTTTSHIILDSIYRYFNANPKEALFFATCNLAVPTQQFLELDGFNPAFWTSEDREFCSRWLQLGWRMVFASDMVVHHAQRNTFQTFWRRHFNYGRGAYRFYRLCALREQRKMKLGPLAFYRKIFQGPFAQRLGHRALAVEALLILSHLANTAGFFAEKRRLKHIPANRLEKRVKH